MDANGIIKGLAKNERIKAVSGYDYLAGDCVMVGMDDKNNSIPLHPFDAVRFGSILKK